MKKKLIAITLILSVVMTIPTGAKANRYYTMTGTVCNFTYTQKYSDGTTLKGKGYDIHTSDGSIWEMIDTDTNQFFKEGQKVKVKLNNNGTSYKYDDIVVSVKAK